QGTEVSLLALVVTLGAWLALQALDGDRSHVPLYLLLGVATWVRPDMVVFAAAILGGLAWLKPAFAREHLGCGAAIVVAFLVAQTGFRLWYFGAPMPNTYYLKLAGYPLIPCLSSGAIVDQ